MPSLPPTAPTGRRRFLAGAGALALATGLAPALRAEDTATADFLFVQTADNMAFDADTSTLTLSGVSPVTLFFADRPERIAGNMSTAKFIPFWSEGKDSFLSDPPNADLSIMENGTLRQTVVVLRDPALEGDRLTYQVTIIDGEMPVTGAEVSVFIDVIGMPLTPVSYAGVARRSFRRAVY